MFIGNGPQHSVSAPFCDNDSAVGEEWSDLKSVLDWRLGVPGPLGQHDRDVGQNRCPKIIADVGAWPDVGGSQVGGEVTPSEVARCRISPEAVPSLRSSTKAGVDQRPQ